MSQFISLCEPERTASGFRLNLVKCVKTAYFLLSGKNDIAGTRVDIWGDGANIGATSVTRMCFRFLCDDDELSTNFKLSAQSANAAMCFVAYQGKDNRFGMEQNVGPVIAGKQESGWLYQQTKQLADLGVEISYSGDTPYLLSLILGISNETSNDTPSHLPIYIPPESESAYLPTTKCSKTGRRSTVEIPFRKDIPSTSLVYARDIRFVSIQYLRKQCF